MTRGCAITLGKTMRIDFEEWGGIPASVGQNYGLPTFPNLLRERERHKLQHRNFLAGIRNPSHDNNLTVLKSIAKVNSDPLQCLALGFVCAECPSENEWYLIKVSNTK